MRDCSVLPVHDLDLEDEGRVGGDHTTDGLGTVGVLRGAGKLSLLALLELSDALVPASDNVADANLELEGLSAGDGRVEDGTVEEGSGVVNGHLGTFRDDFASTFVEFLDSELVGHISLIFYLLVINQPLFNQERQSFDTCRSK